MTVLAGLFNLTTNSPPDCDRVRVNVSLKPMYVEEFFVFVQTAAAESFGEDFHAQLVS